MEHIDGVKLKECLSPELLEETGRMVGKLHAAQIVHGDLITCNIFVNKGTTWLMKLALCPSCPPFRRRTVIVSEP